MSSRDPLVVGLAIVYSSARLKGLSVAGTGLGKGAMVGPIAGLEVLLANGGILAGGEGVRAGLVMGDGVRQRCLRLLLKKAFLSFSNSSTSLGVGVNGFFMARISLSASSAAFSVGGISSITEMTLVNKRCLESDREDLGFKNL